jgi:hypothetical protein
MSGFGDKPTDNHRAARAAKAQVRRNVLAMIEEPRVFDAFAGTGVMYADVWKDAASYVGCDKRWFRDGRKAYVADNRRVLRAIDLKPYNIFDLDAYGAPWEQAIIIAARRELGHDELIGFAITEGGGLGYNVNRISTATAEIAGVGRDKQVGMRVNVEPLIDRCITGLAKRMNAKIERKWQAKRKGATKMHYIGIVLRGL